MGIYNPSTDTMNHHNGSLTDTTTITEFNCFSVVNYTFDKLDPLTYTLYIHDSKYIN